MNELPNTRVQRTRSSPSALRSSLTRRPLGRLKIYAGAITCLLALTAAAGKPADGLLVYGDDWSFMAAEPSGWHGDTKEGARKYGVNIVFYPDAPESKRADVTTRIRVNKKADDDIAEDLKVDMAEYRAKYPAVGFTDVTLKHPTYPLVAKLFSVEGEFFEYVAYLNPGKEYPYILTVALSKAKAAATPTELAAYEEVVRSLVFIRKAA